LAFGKAEEAKPKPLDGKSLGDLFVPATELPSIKWLKIGVWGPPKVGKTHFTMTNPKGKIFIIDTEGSAKVNVQMFPKSVKERVFIFDVQSFVETKDEDIDYDHLISVLEDIVKKITIAIKEEGGENVTLVIDSATDVWEWLSIWVTELPGAKHIGGDKDKVNRLEWGKPNKKYATIFRHLLMAECNVILTFLAKETVDDTGKTLGIEPRWQKNTFRWLDVVGQLEKVGDRRTLRFTGSKNVGGRIVDNLPDLENPDWPKLCAHIAKHSGVKFE
jgi:hypothetical protein